MYSSILSYTGNTNWVINAPMNKDVLTLEDLRKRLGVATNSVIKKAIKEHRLFPIHGTNGSGTRFHISEVDRFLRARV